MVKGLIPRLNATEVSLKSMNDKAESEKIQFFKLLDEAQNDLRTQFEQVTLQC